MKLEVIIISRRLVEKNYIKNEDVHVIFTKEEIVEMEEFLGLDKVEPININSDDDSNFEEYYNEELYNTYKVADKDKAHEAMIDCSKKYNKDLADE